MRYYLLISYLGITYSCWLLSLEVYNVYVNSGTTTSSNNIVNNIDNGNYTKHMYVYIYIYIHIDICDIIYIYIYMYIHIHI